MESGKVKDINPSNKIKIKKKFNISLERVNQHLLSM